MLGNQFLEIKVSGCEDVKTRLFTAALLVEEKNK